MVRVQLIAAVSGSCSGTSDRKFPALTVWQVHWNWFCLLFILGLAGCQTIEPQSIWLTRNRTVSSSRLQRRRAETTPLSESGCPVVPATGEKSNVRSAPQADAFREGKVDVLSCSITSRAEQVAACFVPTVQRSWHPELLVRGNDEPVVPADARTDAEPAEELDWSSLIEPSAVQFESSWQWEPVERSARDRDWTRWERLQADYGNFYSGRSMFQLGTAFLAGAAMANTNVDEMISHDLYQENVVEIANEDISQKLHQPKALGDGYILLPTLAVLALSEPWLEQSAWTKPLGEWGDRGARAMLVGGPVVLLTQNLTGASRPNESPSGSHWEPFQDNNGVSGHAFVGAVPFLTAGRMSRRPWAKAFWYGASTLPALSRVNDERHYFSQVFLGWYLAWLATAAVDSSQQQRQLKITPTWNEAGPGLMLEKHF